MLSGGLRLPTSLYRSRHPRKLCNMDPIVYHSGRDNAYMANAWRSKSQTFLASNYASSLICAAAARGRYGCLPFASHSFKTAKAVKRPLSIATAAATAV